MRPDPARVLMGLTSKLALTVAADCRTPFGQTTAGHAAALTMVLAQEVDRLPERLYRETEAVAAILEDALPFLDPALAGRVREALANNAAPDLRISSLQAATDSVRAILIEVHAAVEAQESAEARAMNERIWDELRESTRRRHVVLG